MPGSPRPRCWWTPLEVIAGNEYNLAPGSYAPRVAQSAPEGDAAQLIKEVLATEKLIAERLEKLLTEVKADT